MEDIDEILIASLLSKDQLSMEISEATQNVIIKFYQNHFVCLTTTLVHYIILVLFDCYNKRGENSAIIKGLRIFTFFIDKRSDEREFYYRNEIPSKYLENDLTKRLT